MLLMALFPRTTEFGCGKPLKQNNKSHAQAPESCYLSTSFNAYYLYCSTAMETKVERKEMQFLLISKMLQSI